MCVSIINRTLHTKPFGGDGGNRTPVRTAELNNSFTGLDCFYKQTNLLVCEVVYDE